MVPSDVLGGKGGSFGEKSLSENMLFKPVDRIPGTLQKF